MSYVDDTEARHPRKRAGRNAVRPFASGSRGDSTTRSWPVGSSVMHGHSTDVRSTGPAGSPRWSTLKGRPRPGSPNRYALVSPLIQAWAESARDFRRGTRQDCGPSGSSLSRRSGTHIPSEQDQERRARQTTTRRRCVGVGASGCVRAIVRHITSPKGGKREGPASVAPGCKTQSRRFLRTDDANVPQAPHEGRRTACPRREFLFGHARLRLSQHFVCNG